MVKGSMLFIKRSINLLYSPVDKKPVLHCFRLHHRRVYELAHTTHRACHSSPQVSTRRANVQDGGHWWVNTPLPLD